LEERSPLGADLQRALAARGREVSLAEARDLALALLDLLRNDLLVPITDDAPSGRPHVYNMGSSHYREGSGKP
jgi:hypothetical protein